MPTFYFITDLLVSRENETSYKINDNLMLRKAKPIECDIIRKDIKAFLANSIFEDNFNPYEDKLKSTRVSDIEEIVNSTKEPNDNWCYWVIEKKKSLPHNYIDNLVLAPINLHCLGEYQFEKQMKELDLSNYTLSYSYATKYNKSSFYHNLKILNYPLKEIQNSDIENINQTFNLIKDFKENSADKYPIIDNTLIDLLNLEQITIDSPFRIVACFSILENLLTTKKSASITHQLSTKINLINNQLKEKINLEEYFTEEISLKKVVSKLYDFRSHIAHGNIEEFSKEKIRCKPGNFNIIIERFIYKELLIKTIIFAMENPSFILYLKEV